jgi:hypothetical protein
MESTIRVQQWPSQRLSSQRLIRIKYIELAERVLELRRNHMPGYEIARRCHLRPAPKQQGKDPDHQVCPQQRPTGYREEPAA